MQQVVQSLIVQPLCLRHHGTRAEQPRVDDGPRQAVTAREVICRRQCRLRFGVLTHNAQHHGAIAPHLDQPEQRCLGARIGEQFLTGHQVCQTDLPGAGKVVGSAGLWLCRQRISRHQGGISGISLSQQRQRLRELALVHRIQAAIVRQARLCSGVGRAWRQLDRIGEQGIGIGIAALVRELQRE